MLCNSKVCMFVLLTRHNGTTLQDEFYVRRQLEGRRVTCATIYGSKTSHSRKNHADKATDNSQLLFNFIFSSGGRLVANEVDVNPTIAMKKLANEPISAKLTALKGLLQLLFDVLLSHVLSSESQIQPWHTIDDIIWSSFKVVTLFGQLRPLCLFKSVDLPVHIATGHK